MAEDYEARRAKALAEYEVRYPLTVSTLADHLYVRHIIHVTCDCGRVRVLDLADMILKVGQDVELTAVATRLRCKSCGRVGRVRLSITPQSAPRR